MTVVLLMVLCVVMLAMAGVYLHLVNPHGTDVRRARLRPYEERLVAHRGLFVPHVHPENSLLAFAAARRQGYGIELDVQLTKDGELVVFHDETLTRMCGHQGRLRDYTFVELQNMRLDGTDERVPLFANVLAIVDGAVPLIVEIKPEGDCIGAAQKTAEFLDKYSGIYCVESFNPRVLEWFRHNCPDVIRGQLSTNYFKDEPSLSFWKKFVYTNLLLNFRTQPDFIAYNHLFASQISLSFLRRLFSVVHVAWTLKSEEDLRRARKFFSVFIFDGFVPSC